MSSNANRKKALCLFLSLDHKTYQAAKIDKNTSSET